MWSPSSCTRTAFLRAAAELSSESDTLARIQIVPEGGPARPRTGAMVRVVGCLGRAAPNDWLLTNSTEPAVTTLTPAAAAEKAPAMKSLGTQTVRLLHVFPSPDSKRGHRIEAKGFLVREASDALAINVVSLTSLASVSRSRRHRGDAFDASTGQLMKRRFSGTIAGVLERGRVRSCSSREPSPRLALVSPRAIDGLGAYVSMAARIKAQLYDAPQARIRALTSAGPPVDLILHHGRRLQRSRTRPAGRTHSRWRDAPAARLARRSDGSNRSRVQHLERSRKPIALNTTSPATSCPRLRMGSSAKSFTSAIHASIAGAGCRPRATSAPGLGGSCPRPDRRGPAVLLDGDRPSPATALTRVQPLLVAVAN